MSFVCRVLSFFAAFLCLLNSFPAGAIGGLPVSPVQSLVQEKDSASPKPDTPPQDRQSEWETLRNEVKTELDKLAPLLNAPESENSPLIVLIREQAERLLQLDFIYNQSLNLLHTLSTLQQEKAALSEELRRFQATGLEQAPPYSYALLDQIEDELFLEEGQRKVIAEDLSATRKAIAEEKEILEDRERGRREARQTLNENTDEAEASILSAKFRIAEIGSAEAKATLDRLGVREKVEEKQEEVSSLKINIDRHKVDWLKLRVEFRETDLKEILEKIDNRLLALTTAIEDNKARLSTAEGEWLTAQKKVQEAPSLLATEEAEAKRAARDRYQDKLFTLTQNQGFLSEEKQIWKKRFRIFNNDISRADLREWRQATLQSIEGLNRAYQREVETISAIRKQVLHFNDKIKGLEKTDADKALISAIETRNKFLKSQIVLSEERLVNIDRTLALYNRLFSHLEDRLGRFSIYEVRKDILSITSKIWHYELTAVDDEPITVRKILIALSFFFAGFALSKYLSRILRRRIFSRLHIDVGARAALQSISFYILVLFFTLIALNVANVPLTFFTLLGGALAIGIGFGSQNLINNFISGLILLIERPIKPGDMIEIDGNHANVIHIGARSTLVRTFNNIDILIPNSTFLEKNVINWTLSDDRYKTVIKVGVAYDSPLEQVEAILEKIAKDHPGVLQDPPPAVVFSDFAESALLFEVSFWLRMTTPGDCKSIESSVRHQIAARFREAGIVIPFAQRDVRINTEKPLEIKLR